MPRGRGFLGASVLVLGAALAGASGWAQFRPPVTPPIRPPVLPVPPIPVPLTPPPYTPTPVPSPLPPAPSSPPGPRPETLGPPPPPPEARRVLPAIAGLTEEERKHYELYLRSVGDTHLSVSAVMAGLRILPPLPSVNLAVVRRELAKVYVQVAAAVASRLVHQAEQMKLGRVEAFRWETPQERFQKLEFIRTEEQAVRRLEREARQEAQPQVRASVREWPSARGDWGHAPIRIQKGPAFRQLERINRSGWGRF